MSKFGTFPFGSLQLTGFDYISELDEDENKRAEGFLKMVSQPPMSFARDMWWESLLFLYMSSDSARVPSLSPGQREIAAQAITSDLRFVFKASNYWFSFFHLPTFFGNFFEPARRKEMQPSLVLALLAMSTFWQSSEVGIGHTGRERALRFRDEAQSALEASVNAGWLDETLAQAAWVSPVSDNSFGSLPVVSSSYLPFSKFVHIPGIPLSVVSQLWSCLILSFAPYR